MPQRILKFPLKNKRQKIKKRLAFSEVSTRVNSEKITDTKSKKLKKERSVDKAKTEIVNTIIEQIKDILEDSTENKDSTDVIIDIITEIFQPILDEFKDLIEENEDKKSFIGGLIKIFTILLSPRTTSLTKIKKVIRISTKIVLDLWPEQK